MYSTCLFCAAPLGANEAIEHFPVGRRLAFDAAKGRLWVVCRQCERWNLTPVEERWEAIEECERLFRDTRLRVSTDQIGLARLREGLDLVRIGTPQRPEIAAWRYGDQFGRRRRKQFVTAASLAAAGAAALATGLAGGIGVVTAWQAANVLSTFVRHGSPLRVVARVRDSHGTVYRIRRRNVLRSRLMSGSNGDLALTIAYDAGIGRHESLYLEGVHARNAMAALLPDINRRGGNTDEVQQAVGRIERAGTAEQFLRDQARRGETLTRVIRKDESRVFADSAGVASSSGLYALSTPASLALEMALHEEQERTALEGELQELEQAWRDAEEIGAIADSLLLPPMVESALAKLRARKSEPR